MGKALYRKYRSRSLDEIVGQPHITDTLRSALKQGKISHAYLLTGPRGTGKTSIARILAHQINGLEYSEEPHLDIIEIDAASNRRIDEIRDLRERVSTAPTSAKYKVYIIDEVHMLTKEAFNALLKTLEEPPAHVIFILATTEVHKLPETIISRTQRYSLQPVALEQVAEHLRSIAKQENITVSDDALTLITEHGEGSFRDSIGLLDQVSTSADSVELHHVEQLLGRPPESKMTELLAALDTHNSLQTLTILRDLYAQGFEAAAIAVRLSKRLRDQLLEGSSEPQVFTLLRQLLAVPGAHSPKHMLELCLLEASFETAQSDLPTTPITKKAQLSQTLQNSTPTNEVKATPVKNTHPSEKQNPSATSPIEPKAKEDKSTPLATDAPEPAISTTAAPARDFNAEELWQNVLSDIKQRYNTLYGIARMAKPRLEADTMHVELKFAFHLKRMNEARNHKILSDTLSKIRGQETVLKAALSVTPDTKSKPSASSPPAGDLTAISNIFGGAELI